MHVWVWAEPNDDVIPQLDCPLCHNQDRRFIVGSWEDPIGVARCTACGLVHATGRRPAPQDEDDFEPRPIDVLARRRHRQTFERYDRMLRGRLRTPVREASILDIGCGDGGWLDEMKLWGYRTEGTHASFTPAGARHRVYELDSSEIGPGLGCGFDVVTSIDQLDRLERPVAALHFAARHLAPGGVVIIEVANWNHRRTRARLIARERQVAFYDRHSLRDALVAVGLTPLALSSAPALLDRALGVAARPSATRAIGRALRFAGRALEHACDASDQGEKLIVIAHRSDPYAH